MVWCPTCSKFFGRNLLLVQCKVFRLDRFQMKNNRYHINLVSTDELISVEYGSKGRGLFKRGVQKLGRFLHKNQHTQRKWLNFEVWIIGKKNENHLDDFWHRKLTLKVIFWHFLTAPHYSNSQNSIIFFGYLYS